ncbi:hypothetical protein C8Q79DRAFT_971422 [Trametes meyenii]|nr:hypothetical protein C8Q79DRAFT_971422 [Trametes meyenii]
MFITHSMDTSTTSGFVSTSNSELPLPALGASGSISMDGIMGVYLLGTSSSLLLYGLSLHQLYRYFRLHPNDTLYIRIIVVVVMLLETFHSVMVSSSCYHYLVSHFGNILAFLKTFWSVALAPVTSSVITGVAQIFFARRVYLLGFIPRLLVFMASVFLLVHIGLALTLTIQM